MFMMKLLAFSLVSLKILLSQYLILRGQLRMADADLIQRRFAFPHSTTYETKIDFLLIEVFSKLFNTQNYGHQGTILGGRFYVSGFLRIDSLSLNPDS
jgi:hypothetical protein